MSDYEMYDPNLQNENSQDEYNEETKNKFEMSIASMGDIYSKIGNQINIYQQSKNTKNNLKSPSKILQNSKSIITTNENALEICILKSSKTNEANRFSHVKMGIINPVKHTNSIKPIYEKSKKTFESDVSKFVLFASKVDIPSTKYPNVGSKTRTKQINKHLNNQKEPEEIVIGNPTYKNNYTKDNSVMINNHNTGNNRNGKSQKIKMSLIEKRQAANSKVTRGLVKQVENLYSDTKNFLSAVNNNLPPKVSFKDLILEGEKIEDTLDNFEKNHIKQTSKIISENNKRKSKSPKLKKQNIQNIPIDNEEQKKLEEKLEILHLTTRQIFDALSRLEENDPKVNVLKQKCAELTNLLKTYSHKYQQSYYENANQDINLKTNENMDEIVELMNPQTNNNNQTNIGNIQNTTTNYNQSLENFLLKHDNVRGSSQTNFNMNSSNIVNIGQSGNIQLHKILASSQNLNEESKENLGKTSSSGIKNINDDSMRLSGTNLVNCNTIVKKRDTQFNCSKLGSTNKVVNSYNKTNFSGNNQHQFSMTNNNNLNQSLNNYNNQSHNNNLNQSQNNYNNQLQNNNLNQSQNNYNNTKEMEPSSSINNFYQSNNFQQTQDPVNLEETIVNFNKSVSIINFQPNEMAQTIINKHSSLSRLNEKNSVKMTLSTEKQPDPIINNQEIRQDDRFTSYNVELPIDYYVNFVKTNEPPSNKEWYVRPHHIESFTKNDKGIPDDVLNTKYISYYSPSDIQHPITRQEQIDEVISKLENNIDNLKRDFYVSMNKDKNNKKKYEELEKFQDELKKTYKQGQVFEEMNKDKGNGIPNNIDKNTNFSQMFDKNENVHQTNLVINTYETLLDQLRLKEKEIILRKRKEELEKIRPPQEKWWEDKTHHFQQELRRNRMVLNANPDYFDKLLELEDEQLY